MKQSNTHEYLIFKGRAWLNRYGVYFMLEEPQNWITLEFPDLIGWSNQKYVPYLGCKSKWGETVLIECKTSRSDFIADQKKPFRVNPKKGMGEYRYYICPEGLIKPNELPENWGLIYVKGASCRTFIDAKKQAANKGGEALLLLTALKNQTGKQAWNYIDGFIKQKLEANDG